MDVKIFLMKKAVYPLAFVFFVSCGMAKKDTSHVPVIEKVKECVPLLGEDSFRPQVCSKCNIKLKDGRLLIQPSGGCPRYEAYRCTTEDGRVFEINNLTCTPKF